MSAPVLPRPLPAHGRPLAPPIALDPAEPLQVTLVGELLEHAELRLSPGNHLPTVTVLIVQPGRQPVRAVEVFGEGHAAYHVAQVKARGMRRGQRVELRGEGLISLQRRDFTGVQLALVHSLRLLDAPLHHRMAAANDRDHDTLEDRFS